METLIVIALIAIIAGAFFASGNYFTQAGKGKDAKRKSDLASLQIKMEDYYTDNNRYPSEDLMDQCRVPLGNYINSIPCDPRGTPYFYQAAPEGEWYRIYANFDYNQDPAIIAVGCTNGCGPSGNTVFDYGVSSPNTTLEFATPVCGGGVPPSCGNPGAYCGQIGTCCPGTEYTMTCTGEYWCCPN